MKVRFRTTVADGVKGEFMEGRVITIDPAAPDYHIFERWLNAGILEAVRDDDPGIAGPRTAPERAVAQPAPRVSRGAGRTKPSSASAGAPA